MGSSVADRQLLTIKEVVQRLRVSRRTVYALRLRRDLRPIGLPGVRKVLFDAADVEALIQSGKA